MKAFSTVLSLLSVASTSAFVVPMDRAVAATVSPTRLQMAADRSPELEAAISDVRECASSFSDETAHFANAWIDKMLEGKQDGMAAGLLDECLIEGDNAEKCAKYEAALKKLDSLLGVGAGEQY